MLISITCISLCLGSLNAVLYDCFSGIPANGSQLAKYAKKQNTHICTVNVEECDPNQWRSMDGSCNNLRYPSRGTQRTPTIRILQHEFNPSYAYEPRQSKSGFDLPLARYLRWELLHAGRANDLQVTQLASCALLHNFHDIMSLHDSLNYILYTPDCCTARGMKDYKCSQIIVPRNDPVHRFSGVSCFNITKPIGFHSYNCRDYGTKFTRMVFATSVFDLSQTYNPMPGYINSLRVYRNGMLKMEVENGRLYPPSDQSSQFCPLNVRPHETRCLKYHSNGGIGSILLNIFFYRFHNHIARILQKRNPCWSDNRIFYTARDINIAVSTKIFFYDLLPIFLGWRNMMEEGLISDSEGFRDMYDETVLPKISDEYAYVQRWFHTIQETKLKLFDKDGFFVRSYPLVNLTARPGFFTVGNNIDCLTQGTFRQASAAFDHIIDVDMAERILGPLQYASDVGSSDLFKGRLFGFAPYIKYREYCGKRAVVNFCDLQPDVDLERIHRLREVYQHASDIDLMAGIWVEKHVRGGRVPRTVYCLMMEQLLRTIKSDRHWFERRRRPHAFSLAQLQAVRRTTMAGVLCAVGDSVTEVQPNPFYVISQENPLTPCQNRKIGHLVLNAWQDARRCT